MQFRPLSKHVHRTRRAIMTMALGATLLVQGATLSFAASPVTVTYRDVKGQKKEVATETKTVGEFLKELGVKLEKGQVVFPAANVALEDKTEVKVLTPKKRVIVIDGRVKDVNVAGETTAEILRSAGILVQEGQRVSPGMDEKVQDGVVILIETIHDVKTTTETRDIELAYETEIRKDPSLTKGERRVLQQGKTGHGRQVLEHRSTEDRTVATVVLETEVVEAPVKEIILEGTKDVQPTVNGKRYKKKITMQATAYDPTAGTMTATGTRAKVGTVAVDPRVIPLGSKLYVESTDGFPSYGIAVAEDTGGAIKGNRIDLFYNTNAEANRFGRRNVTVYVLAE